MVTVELAIGLLTVALVTVVAAFVVSAVVVQTRCADTAASVARQLARGDEAAAARARSNAPGGAVVSVTTGNDRVRVTVSVEERLGRLGPVRLSSRAEAALEPGLVP